MHTSHHLWVLRRFLTGEITGGEKGDNYTPSLWWRVYRSLLWPKRHGTCCAWFLCTSATLWQWVLKQHSGHCPKSQTHSWMQLQGNNDWRAKGQLSVQNQDIATRTLENIKIKKRIWSRREQMCRQLIQDYSIVSWIHLSSIGLKSPNVEKRRSVSLPPEAFSPSQGIIFWHVHSDCGALTLHLCQRCNGFEIPMQLTCHASRRAPVCQLKFSEVIKSGSYLCGMAD